MAREREVQYVSDEDGNAVGVIVPIDLWNEIASERETNHLLKSPKMRARLLEAVNRTGGTSLEEARETLGV